MKENINMNTLSATEKQVTNMKKKKVPQQFSSQGIWVPKLVFVNTEKKLNTKNDAKAFAVARWEVTSWTRLIFISRRNSSYTKSEHSVLDNIYIFEVTHKHVLCWTLSRDHREKATQSRWVGFMMFLGSVNMTCAGKLLQSNAPQNQGADMLAYLCFLGIHLTHRHVSCSFRQE